MSCHISKHPVIYIFTLMSQNYVSKFAIKELWKNWATVLLFFKAMVSVFLVCRLSDVSPSHTGLYLHCVTQSLWLVVSSLCNYQCYVRPAWAYMGVHRPPHPAALPVNDEQHQVCRSVEQRGCVHKQIRISQMFLSYIAWSLFHKQFC